MNKGSDRLAQMITGKRLKKPCLHPDTCEIKNRSKKESEQK